MSKPYRTCPDCGSHLDPGEHCDCGKTEVSQKAVMLSGKKETTDKYQPVLMSDT